MGKAQSMHSQNLVEAMQNGGKAREMAMKELYRSHAGKVIAFIRQHGGEEEEARDIFQDAVIQVMIATESGTFKGQSSLGTYLFAVSKNLWFSRIRRQQTERKYRAQLLPQEQQILDSTPEVRLMDRHQTELVKEVIGQLGEKCQQVLSMWSRKYAMKEIAGKVGYANEQIARNKKTQCMKALKNLVKENPNVQSLVRELITD